MITGFDQGGVAIMRGSKVVEYSSLLMNIHKILTTTPSMNNVSLAAAAKVPILDKTNS